MAEVVGQGLKLVSGHVAENREVRELTERLQRLPVVPEDLVVTGPGGALDPLVRHQVEIPLGGMVDALVHHSPGQSVPVLVFVVVSREKPSTHPVATNYYQDYPDLPGVVSLLDNNEGDGRIISILQLSAGCPDGHQLLSQDSQELERGNNET